MGGLMQVGSVVEWIAARLQPRRGPGRAHHMHGADCHPARRPFCTPARRHFERNFGVAQCRTPGLRTKTPTDIANAIAVDLQSRPPAFREAA